MHTKLVVRTSQSSQSKPESSKSEAAPRKSTDTQESEKSLSNYLPQNPRSPSDASLLGLPGELRNEIYRFALLEDKMIKVSPAFHVQPALLHTSRQIRTEALPIWMTENTFKVDAWDMMLTIPSNYTEHWLSRVEYKQFYITMRGRKDWGNLKEWLRRYAKHEIPGLAAGQPTDEAEILSQAFEMVYCLLGKCSFEQMGPVLDAWIRSVELAGVEFNFQ